MNKKNYIEPELNVVRIKVNKLLSSSAPGLDRTSSFGDENDVGGRIFDFDDEE